MPFNNQNGNNVENGPFGGVANPAGVIILSSAPPSTAATDLRIGTMGILPSSGVVYQVTNNTGINGTVTWTALGGGTTAIATINSQAPIAGNYVLAGTANQITKTDTAGTTTFSLPAALTAPGSITAAVGNITATNGNLVLSTIGNGLQIKEGSNARMGQATLTNGSVTVANTSITANTRIFLSRASNNASTALGILQTGAISVGVNFVIEAGTAATPDTPVAGDQSTVNWMLVEAA